MKKIKNKKVLAAVAGVAGLGVIGGVIAYNHDAISFNNIFGVGDHLVSFTDEFVAPETWQPCQSVDKKVTVTNNSSDDVAVRVKFNEYWRTANSQTSSDDHSTSDLSLTFDKSGTQSPIAVITQLNPNDWTYNSTDGWYYYKEDLAPNATTSAFLGSVMMDCDFNTVGSIQYSQDGLTGESQPTAYANATYHIFVTGETIDATKKDSWTPAAPEPYEADCDDPSNDLLYDKIACATNGADTNMDYDVDVTSTATGLGVNTLASSVNDPYATYYYRGDVNNNNVLWADNCWKIIRTTETGGVKMIWMGTPSNGQCVDTSANDGILGNNNYEYIDDTDKYLGSFSIKGDFRAAGYMYSNVADKYADYYYDGIDPSTTYYFANDVTYENGSYTLVNYVQSTYAAEADSITAGRHYFCLNGTTSCEDVAYLWYFGTTSTYPNVYARYALFGNGTTVDTFEDVLNADDISSNAKNQIDNWFGTNIASARRADLEDTVFCNDRTITTGSLTGKDVSGADLGAYGSMGTAATGTIYGALARSNGGTPNVGCSSTQNSYTTSSSNGNGKLTYPVGLITYDEVGLAGGWSHNRYTYLHAYNSSNMLYTWTMSPAGVDRDDGMKILDISGGYNYTSYSGNGFSPVVSLKVGAKFTGTGTPTDPYVISF